MSKNIGTSSPEQLSTEVTEQILADFYHLILDECDNWEVQRPPYLDLRSHSSAEDFLDDLECLEDRYLSPSFQEDHWQCGLDYTDYSEATSRLPAILKRYGLTLDPQSIAFKKLARRAMRIGIAAFRAAQKRGSVKAIDQEARELLAKVTARPLVGAEKPSMPRPRDAEIAPTGSDAGGDGDTARRPGYHDSAQREWGDSPCRDDVTATESGSSPVPKTVIGRFAGTTRPSEKSDGAQQVRQTVKKLSASGRNGSSKEVPGYQTQSQSSSGPPILKPRRGSPMR